MLLTIADFPAKSTPFQSVLTHGLVTGLTAQALVQSYLSKGVIQKLSNTLNIPLDETEQFVGYFTALHDIGKMSPEFVSGIASEELLSRMKAEGIAPAYHSSLKYRHEKTTQIILTEIWLASGYPKLSVRFLSSVLGAHHQGKSGTEERCGSNWGVYHRELERYIREFFYSSTPFKFPGIQKQDQGFLGAVLLGLTILADWIASGEVFQDAETWVQQGNSYTQVRCRVTRFLQESGLQRHEIFGGSSFCSVWLNIPFNGMRSVQKELEQLFYQTNERLSLILLEAPMGEGKTEAGIYAALQMARQWEKNGFYIGLPTSATANQMVDRVRSLLALHKKEDRVRLLHAMAWLVDQYTPEDCPMGTEDASTARRWLEPLRRGLLSSYAVGTVDQAMMAAMMIKYGVLRLLGLSGKVLIIDELHAYDVYMSEILICLVQWCKELEVPVVLLSATLPPEKKRQILSVAELDDKQIYPAITAVTESGRILVRSPETARRQQVEITLEPILHAPASIAEKALQLIKHGGCACVLMNTVRQAQEVYQVLQAQDTEAHLILFHAQFPAVRRDELERECIRLFGKDKRYRPDKAILVATQVVEQSLDIDMDVLLTAVAPMDLLLQRTGRMYRHDDTPRPASFTAPRLFVLVPENGDLAADGFVYPECLLRQSIHLLNARKELRIPEDMAQLVADGYNMEKAPQEELDAWLKRLMEDQIRSSRGEFCTLGNPKGAFRPIRDHLDFDDLEQDSFLSAKTRMGEPSERIALLEGDLYQQVEKRIQTRQGIPYAPVVERELARKVLEQSVSVRKKRLAGFQGIHGERLLEGVQIFKAKQGTYTAPDGRMICFDPALGVLWKEARAK